MYALETRMEVQDDSKEHTLDTASVIVTRLGFKYQELGFMENGSAFTIPIAANEFLLPRIHD